MDLPEDTRAGLLANVAPGDNSPPLSVSELSGALKRTDRERVRPGPRARRNLAASSATARATAISLLKDENACIDAVIWRDQRGRARIPARGRRRSHRHRQAHHLSRAAPNIRSSSIGWSWRARARCWRCSSGGARRLPPKGCSTPERKRRLPFLPQVIGVVTSPTGAVIRDILHRLEDRCPTHVIVWPVPVQGEGAAAKIAEAIRGFPVDRAAARPADRRPRRRLDRGSVGVQ